MCNLGLRLTIIDKRALLLLPALELRLLHLVALLSVRHFNPDYKHDHAMHIPCAHRPND